ncbi:MAG: glycoside hydrolase family 3 N-terminal domain-containing protein [Bariatricus sp.]|nr:glycoside hydrolase family 3 N-terminal domain-containing protein [Bariatricus sp.]
MKNYITFAKPDDCVLPYEKPHRALARRAASEGIVLLENDGSLPLTPGNIALYGAGAAMTIKGGTGSGEVNERYSTSIMEGLESSGFQITTKAWIDDYAKEYAKTIENLKKEINSALKKLNFSAYMGLFLQSMLYPYGRKITQKDLEESHTDTCIYVVARQSGEGNDRSLENNDFSLSEIEQENIRFCAEHYSKTIVVLNIGSSFDTSFMDEIFGINALIYLCQLGSAGGEAFADIITGRITPSGKLSDTWVKSYNDVPFGENYSFLNGNLENEDYLEDIYVGYRYYDTFHVEPRYPFGYGLSYTTFSIEYQSASMKNDTITVNAQVRNTGTTYSGKEIVQLYASCPAGNLEKEYQRLVAFTKTGILPPGESENVELSFPLSSLTSYDEKSASFILEKGRFLLRIGNSSRNTSTCTVLELSDDICVSKHKNICPLQNCLETLNKSTRTMVSIEDEYISSMDTIQITPAMIPTVTYSYNPLPVCRTSELKAQLKGLTVPERIELVCGAGMKDMLMNSSYIKVPGAAGNTTSKLLNKGIVNIVLADGPAGIRLQRRSTITKNGTTKMIDMQIDMMKYFPEFIKNFLCGNPEKDKIYYQYTTAFPVATAMAQTWNLPLLEEVGTAVAEEMKEYGVTFWLAPALNIHRNPLCGRNFEYYSEDPVLSGKMAAAITKGVQSIPGCYVTLKHFCGNNQEANRDHVSSNMTERTLREIYLKGFEIAVREGNAGGMMTSYNKINGIYSSNSKDLLTTVLRQEWNFKGLVMTDWTATAKGKSNAALCMEAGNDLLMPGSSYDKKCIKNALKNHTLSKRALNRCAGNVLLAVKAAKVPH